MSTASEFLHTDGRGGFFCGVNNGEITRKWHGWWYAENPPRGRRRLLAGFDFRVTHEGSDYWLTNHWEKDRWVAADLEVDSPRLWRIPRPGKLAAEPMDFVIANFHFQESTADLVAELSLGKATAPQIRILTPNDTPLDAISCFIVEDDSERELELRDREVLADVSLELEKDCERVWVETLQRRTIIIENNQRNGAMILRIRAKQPTSAEGFAPQASDLRIHPRWKNSVIIDDLRRAADQFIVRGGDGSTTILAGYPWFTDWGRDAMISIPGLCIATGRINEAREIVRHFLAHMNQGIIPNIFPEHGAQPRYNTVDATLWMVDVIFRLWTIEEIAGDSELCERLREIVEWHERGTHNNIRMDSDGLLVGGDAGTQLTWMDVKVNGHVPTPRHGKPVEIQGLWYNALMLIGKLAMRCGNDALAGHCAALGERAAAAFAKRFASKGKLHLADVVDRDGDGASDWSLRPNMIIPFALHHNIIPAAKRADVLRATAEELLTPRGLRTLGPQEPKYHSIYRGDVVARDHAYHQGTVWMWLLGPYVAGVIAEKRNVPELHAQLPAIAEGLIEHFVGEGCYGQCNEIFDADPPHIPRGCFAQAWSTAALIQILQYDPT